MDEPLLDASSWNAFCDQLRQAGQQILENAPDSNLDRAEGFRYLSRLTANALGRFSERPDPLRPQISYQPVRIGGDNPDFLYGSCSVSGTRQYLIRGHRQQAFNVGIGAYFGGLGSGQGLQCAGYLLLSDLEVEADGSFEIQVSEQPREGNWLPMTAECNALLIRQTVLNRGVDIPASLEIHCLESLDYLDYRTHYNHANAQVDDDGKVRLYIARTDPGVANWIDTAGHCRGCISMRWIKAEEDRNAATRLVKLSGLTAG